MESRAEIAGQEKQEFSFSALGKLDKRAAEEMQVQFCQAGDLPSIKRLSEIRMVNAPHEAP